MPDDIQNERAEILNRAERRFGSADVAQAWYSLAPLPGFLGQTPQQLVEAGRAVEVLEYLDAIGAGINA